MTLKDYLEEHSTQPVEESLHRRLLNDIAKKLPRIGITEPADLYREVDLIEGETRIGAVDLVALSQNQLYLIEAKVINSNRRRNTLYEINKQLQKAYEFFREHFGVAARMIGVYKQTRAKNFQHYERPRPIEHLAGG